MNVQQWTLIICLSSFVVMIVTVILTNGAKRRQQEHELERRRLDVLQEALQRPTLDAAMRAELSRIAQASAGSSRAPAGTALRTGDWWHLLWFGPGWVLFVVGGCMLAADTLDLVTGVSTKTFLPMTITGFAMLTLPMALRELTARRDRATATGR